LDTSVIYSVKLGPLKRSHIYRGKSGPGEFRIDVDWVSHTLSRSGLLTTGFTKYMLWPLRRTGSCSFCISRCASFLHIVSATPHTQKPNPHGSLSLQHYF